MIWYNNNKNYSRWPPLRDILRRTPKVPYIANSFIYFGPLERTLKWTVHLIISRRVLQATDTVLLSISLASCRPHETMQ